MNHISWEVFNNEPHEFNVLRDAANAATISNQFRQAQRAASNIGYRPIINSSRYMPKEPPLNFTQIKADLNTFSDSRLEFDMENEMYSVVNYDPNNDVLPPDELNPVNNITPVDEEPVVSLEEAAVNTAESEMPLGSLIAGAAISSVQSAISGKITDANVIAASQGLGPNGHAFDAMSHAQSNANTDNIYSEVRSGIIGLSSLAGPEGLAAGGLLAAATVIPQSMGVGYQSENTTQATSGDMINDASTQ